MSQTCSSTTGHREYLTQTWGANMLSHLAVSTNRIGLQAARRLISLTRTMFCMSCYFLCLFFAADCFLAFITRSTHISMYDCTRLCSMFSLLLWHIYNRSTTTFVWACATHKFQKNIESTALDYLCKEKLILMTAVALITQELVTGKLRSKAWQQYK